MFKVNNRNTRTRCEICSKLTITPCSSVSIVNFEQVNAGWVFSKKICSIFHSFSHKKTKNRRQRHAIDS